MTPAEREVLVIDDEDGFHDLFRFVLEPLGVRVESAHDGLEGLELGLKKDYALIFLDTHMPKMRGTEVLKKLKEKKAHQKVVLLSSESDPDEMIEQQALAIGVVAYLKKPFDVDRVLAIIETLH